MESEVPVINGQPHFFWHLEVSSKCTLECPRCPRTEKPGKYKITELSLEFIQKVMTKEILEKTFEILICGGQGDPIYCKDLIHIVRYIKENNPTVVIKIITNGSYKTKTWWEQLAQVLTPIDCVVFSVDGWDNESNNKYRVNNNFDSILTGVETLARLQPNMIIVWSTIVFSFNEDHLDKIKEVAEHAGATHWQIVKSSLFGSKIPSYIDETLGYDPLEPTNSEIKISKYAHSSRLDLLTVLRPVNDSDAKYYRDLRNQKIRSLANKLQDEFKNSELLPGCMLNERGLYIDAEGILYPCSWISHPFGVRKNHKKTIYWKDSLFVKYKDKFNLYKYSLDAIINSEEWNKLKCSFYDRGKHFVECSDKCNKVSTLARLGAGLGLKVYDKNNINLESLKGTKFE